MPSRDRYVTFRNKLKRIIRAPNTPLDTPAGPAAVPSFADDRVDFDVDVLLAQGGAILAREIKNLMMASSRGKLEAAEARDLVAYLKLLSELKIEQQKALADLTDVELQDLVSQDQPKS